VTQHVGTLARMPNQPDTETQFLIKALALLGIHLSEAQATELERFTDAKGLPCHDAVSLLIRRGLTISLVMDADGDAVAP
jgi:hypothetical protein